MIAVYEISVRCHYCTVTDCLIIAENSHFGQVCKNEASFNNTLTHVCCYSH